MPSACPGIQPKDWDWCEKLDIKNCPKDGIYEHGAYAIREILMEIMAYHGFEVAEDVLESVIGWMKKRDF